jgi:thioredoxin 1
MGQAVAITDASFDAEVLNGPNPVVVDFWAEWCAPCRMVAPVLEELAVEYGGKVKVAKLNIDDNPSTSAKFGIRSIPTLLFFKGGRLVDQYVGAASKNELKKRFDGLL